MSGPEYRFYEKNEPIRKDGSQTLALGEVAAAGLWDETQHDWIYRYR